MNFLKRLFGSRNEPTRDTPRPQQPEVPKPARPSGPDISDFSRHTFRFIALDVETANSEPSSICQIGLALVGDNGSIKTRSFMIDPETHFDAFNVDLHGITPQAVADAPNFETTVQVLRPTLERHMLIQHSKFDQGAMDAACARYFRPKLRATWLDSVMIARHAWPELKGNGGHGLASLKDFLGLDFEHHNAAEDARAAAEVVLRAENHTKQSFETLAQPLSRSGKTYQRSVAIEGSQDGPLYGHVACFTGKITLSRTEASTIAAGAGITVKSGVSKKVTLLVVGEQDLSNLAGHSKSSKHRRAEELIADGCDIRIIGEQEFLKLVRK